MNILHLAGWDVQVVDEEPGEYRVKATFARQPAGCPYCNTLFDQLYKHGTRPQVIADLPSHGRRVSIHLTRNRYRCRSCLKTFLQPLPDVDERSQMTRRLADWIGEQSIRRTFTSVAEEVGVDEKTVRNLFNAYIDRLDAETVRWTPTILGIDEVHLLGKPRCVLTNIEERTMLDVLEKRDKKTVIAYLKKLHCDTAVKVVTMDMWRPYYDAVKLTLPKAAIVIDKFHVVRMASQALERIRKSFRAGLESKERRRLMHDRFILLRRPKDLTEEQRATLAGWSLMFPKLADAYRLKEEFYSIWDIPKKEDAMRRYLDWRNGITDLEMIGAYQPLLTAMANWEEPIFAYWDHRFTNACTEALNGIAKLIERTGRGYSFKAMRAKMLYSRKLQKTESSQPPARSAHPEVKYVGCPLEGPSPIFGTDIDALLKDLEAEARRLERSTGRRE